jgi:PhnB protein
MGALLSLDEEADMAVNPIPEGRDGLIPYLLVDGASDAIDFWVRAFGATELYRLPMPGGLVGHAEVSFGDALLYVADAPQDMPGAAASPTRLGGTSVLIHRFVTDVDDAVARAVAEGATVVRPPADQFYGDRAAVVEDPWGHQWSIHTHLRDVSPEEMLAAMDEMLHESGDG